MMGPQWEINCCKACGEDLRQGRAEDNCESCGGSFWCCVDPCPHCGVCVQNCCDCEEKM